MLQKTYETWQRTLDRMKKEGYLTAPAESQIRERDMLEGQYWALHKERVDAPVLGMLEEHLDVVNGFLRGFAECLHVMGVINEGTRQKMHAEIRMCPEAQDHENV